MSTQRIKSGEQTRTEAGPALKPYEENNLRVGFLPANYPVQKEQSGLRHDPLDRYQV
jgi:hypothetical protein